MTKTNTKTRSVNAFLERGTIAEILPSAKDFKDKLYKGHLKQRLSESLETCADIQHRFLEALFEELSILDEFNRNKPWREQQSMQVYMFDSYELRLFNRFLQEAAKDAR